MNILYYCKGVDDSILHTFRRRLPDARIIDWQSERADIDPTEVDAAIAWMPPPDFFDGLQSLTHVFAFSAGVDHLLQHPGLRDDIVVVRLRDAGMADQMAEYALYGVLHAQRQMGKMRQAQLRGEWRHDIRAISAEDMSVGILGAGALGLQVASRLSMNGYPVACWSRTQRPSPDGRVRMFAGAEDLPDFLARCHALVCLLPLTDATTGILNRELFAQLPAGAFLINPGRGGHLVEQDLLEALASGQLEGALLDVFASEPLPADHAFWSHPDILITPHVAAQSLENESVDQIVDSIGRVQRGDVPTGIVDRKIGY